MNRYNRWLALSFLVFFAGSPAPLNPDEECTVFGRVLDCFGKPAEGVKIEVEIYKDPKARTVFTDEEGIYKVTGLKPDTCYIALFEKESNTSRHKSVHRVAPGQKIRVDFLRYKDAAALCGGVLDEEGNPIPDCGVMIVNSSHQYREGTEFIRIKTKTDEQGFFCVDNLFPGTFDIDISKYGGSCSRSPGETVVLERGVEKEVTIRIRPGRVSGRVEVEGGMPEGETGVSVGAYMRAIRGTWRTTTDEEGVFEMDNLLPGTYEVYASLSGYFCKRIHFEFMEGTELDEVVIRLIRGGFIVFEVKDRKGKLVSDVYGERVTEGAERDYLYLDKIGEGKFRTVKAVPPGEQEIVLRTMKGLEKTVKVVVEPGEEVKVEVAF